MTEPISPKSLGSYIRMVLNERGMSANMLAQASGVAESTIRSLLKQGEDLSAPGPHPLVLRAVCDALGLDHIRIFQMAGYIPLEYQPAHLTPSGEYVGVCFDAMTPDQQAMLLGMIASLDRSKQLPLGGKQMAHLVQEVAHLRQQYGLFRFRKAPVLDEIGRIAGNLLRPNLEELYLERTFLRLSALFQGDADMTITRAHIQQVIHHANAAAVVNILLPRKEMYGSLEKLYWLIHP
ncbi:MAG: helix-turn-helix domain-containing protein, partial [Chloroflexi bacterium]|nr:helix-turn-helix domain-containing protein [Chloroflexota bacterium]